MREVAGRIPENSKDLVSKILQKALGYQADSIEQIKGMGMNNAVTVASTSHGRFVVRTNVASHLVSFQREAWCYKQLESTPVLTPTVLGLGVLIGHSYSIAPFIADSQPIGESIDQSRVWRILGSYARHLNQIQPPNIQDEANTYFPTLWEQQVASDVEIIFKDNLWIDRSLLTASEQDLAKSYLLGCATMTAPRGVSQFDLTTANAVICNSDYNRVYLLDLESANIAPVPYYQLACIAADKGPDSENTKAFFDGYGLDREELRASPSEVERFTLLRLMRGTAWARDRYPIILDERLKQTEPVLARVLSRNFC